MRLLFRNYVLDYFFKITQHSLLILTEITILLFSAQIKLKNIVENQLLLYLN